MNKLIAALTIAIVALPAASLPSAAAKLGQGGKQATLESAPTAKGEKSFFKSVELACAGTSCTGTFKGKAGRLVSITEIQCAVGSDGQAQGGQVAVEAVFLELLPIASRATDGANEIAMSKTPTSFVLDGAQMATIGFFFFGTPNFASCLVKGTSMQSS
jgi:hypothetical protein